VQPTEDKKLFLDSPESPSRESIFITNVIGYTHPTTFADVTTPKSFLVGG
jgi:hypothetical protein